MTDQEEARYWKLKYLRAHYLLNGAHQILALVEDDPNDSETWMPELVSLLEQTTDWLEEIDRWAGPPPDAKGEGQ